MAIATIPIKLEGEAARLYMTAAPEMQDKLRLLVNMWLRELVTSSSPLSALMDAISDKAQARGLTPELLETLLQND